MKKGENTVRYDIVMVTYNSMKWLRACVAALAAVQYPLEELHLVFADNGSTDGTLEELRRMAGEYPAFGGFTVAENGANRDATGAYVAVCEELGRGDYDALVGTDIAGLFDAPPAKSASFPPIAGRSSRAIGGWNGIKGGEEK